MAASDRLPSAREIQKLATRMRQMKKQVRRLNLRALSLQLQAAEAWQGPAPVEPRDLLSAGLQGAGQGQEDVLPALPAGAAEAGGEEEVNHEAS